MKKLIYHISTTFFSLMLTQFSFADDTGFISPGTTVNDASIGTIAWGGLSNATLSDDNYVSSWLAIGQATNYLKATNFGFNIPAGATVNGIEVEIEKSFIPDAAGSVSDLQVRIVKNGIIGSTIGECCNWPTSDASQAYGGTTDAWGETWTPADINNANFGIAIAGQANLVGSGTAQIDQIRLKINYSNPIVPLPVELVKLNINHDIEGVYLNWTTASEINNNYFEIQRSFDNNQFETIGMIEGNGNTNQLINYSFIDNNVDHNNTFYYRIKQVDYDGDFEYFNTLSITISPQKVTNNDINVFPNPFLNNLNITLNTGHFMVEQVRLKTITGAILIEQHNNFSHSLSIQLDQIPKGVYFLELAGNETTLVKRVVKK